MKKRTFGLVAAFITLIGLSIAIPATLVFARTSKSTDTEKTVSVSELREQYAEANDEDERVRILVMPGHEPDFGGAQFQGVYEREINVEIADQLADYFDQNERFEIIVARSNSEWNNDFDEYFDEEDRTIERFVKEKKRDQERLIKRGKFEERGEGEQVAHAAAPSDGALRLYGINKWANENDIDLVVHLHINDAPDHGPDEVGANSGYAVYVPDKQYGNAKTSRPLGEAIAAQLSQLSATSTLSIENKGVVEDQELIALGAYDTLYVPSVLVEYGYITESKFTQPEVRQTVTKDFALLTYKGIQAFFNDRVVTKYPSASLPYTFTETPTVGSSSPATYALQSALNSLGLYPTFASTTADNARLMAPTLTTCPISGLMDQCTVNGIEAFQAARGLKVTGTLDAPTRAALNALFSDQPVVQPVVLPVEPDGGIGSTPNPAPTTTVTPTASVVGSCALPTRDLALDDTDAKTNGDVTRLQKLLAKDKTIYPAGLITGTFGPATLKAVQAFQTKQEIVKSGAPGSGLVGPKTKALLGELCK